MMRPSKARSREEVDMENEARKVEKYMVDNYSEPNLSKILKVQAVNAVPPGVNFLSIIWRVTLKVLLSNGETKSRNFILKNMPIDHERCEIAIQMGFFAREIITYELVLKKMDEVMTQFNHGGERPWCNFIMHHNYMSLLLEDLKPLGYETTDRMQGLSPQDAELAFKALGSFHAASKAAVFLGHVKLSALRPRVIVGSPKHIESFFVRPIRFLSRSIEKSWGPQWEGVQAKLDKPTEEIVNKMMNLGEVNEERFNTILHGDVWSSNIMFLRDSSGHPKSVKFVDFQLSFYNTIAWDLTYLIFSSLLYNVRKQHSTHLLKVYLSTLQDDLWKYGYPEEKIPTDEYLLNEMKRLRFWGLITLLFYCPIFLAGATGNNEDANIIMNPALGSSKIPGIYSSKIFRDMCGDDILELLNEGAMDWSS